jgi:hypothetical protein
VHLPILPKTSKEWKLVAFRLLISANLLFSCTQLYSMSEGWQVHGEVDSHLGWVQLCGAIVLLYISVLNVRIYKLYATIGLCVGVLALFTNLGAVVK